MQLFSLHNIICIWIFRTDCLALDNQLVFSSMGQTVSTSQNSLATIVSLCRAKSSWASLCALEHTCCPYSAHSQAALSVIPYGCSVCMTRRHHLTVKSPILWLLQSFHSLFHDDPQVFGVGVVSYMHLMGLGSITLCFDLLWYTAMFSMCWKEKCLWGLVRSIRI